MTNKQSEPIGDCRAEFEKKTLLSEFLELPEIVEQWEQFKQDNSREGLGS